VGPDAVVVEGDRGRRPFIDYLAVQVEELLELEPTENPTLNEVACRFLARAGPQRMAEIYISVQLALKESRFEPPEVLRKLAGIRAFHLYVTTTFDDLLRRAIDLERFGGAERTRKVAYSPAGVGDLPAPLSSFADPVVYHLLGRASAAPEYAVTEEDTLEFMHSLQSEERRPKQLLEELKPRSLLIIGSGYPDWLTRFFLRIARCERLLVAQSQAGVVAEENAGAAAPLETFLRYFSGQTRIYQGGALAFVDELAERWARHTAGRAEDPPGPGPADPAAVEHAIFISYASEDRDTAAALAAALVRAGLPVWFDRGGGLEGGVLWRRTIRRQIQTASIFVPLLSPHVLTSARRFFRVEWRIAGEIAPAAPESLPFVVPVKIGEVAPDAQDIDESIRAAHWLTAGGGEGGFDEVVRRLQEIYRGYRLTLAGAG
jgi:hypothetical protein